MIRWIMSRVETFIGRVVREHVKSKDIIGAINDTKMLAARRAISDIQAKGLINNIHDVEFKVFSQFGDDGIIQYLIQNIEIPQKKFIEFGVQNYQESNTRFLLMNNNWKGLVIEGNKEDVDYIKKDEIYWRYDLTAVNCFITKENINKIFSENGFTGEVGLLSIDIDGNDYWIWECINVVNPIIVIVEYNSVFGPHYAVTVPYDPSFIRTKAHYSNLYWGCSLKGFYLIAKKKGYSFIGCNSNGNNAYFVRKDKLGDLKTLTIEEGYVESKFRESRDINGYLTFVSGADRLKAIEEMPVIDLESNKEITINALKGKT